MITKYIKLISVVDTLIVEDVIVNRGNVPVRKVLSTEEYMQGLHSAAAMEKIAKAPAFPTELLYGKDLKFTVSNEANILEIRVKTNHGEWIWNF